MKRNTALFAAIVILAALAAPVGAQDAGLEPRGEPASAKGQAAAITVEAPSLDAEVKVFIQLTAPSVGEYIADERELGRNPTASAKRNQANLVEGQQDDLREDLEEFDASEEFELDYGANGLAVTVRVGDLLDIAALPNVKSVARVARHSLTNETSVPFIGAPEVWGPTGEFDGDGISIAVIDTGIDYLHANFDGPGTIPDYTANDPTTLNDGGFTEKVVGGMDFVGDAYDAESDLPAINTPKPDPDPLDCNGHGSHVAGSAAGNGVVDQIGPGVAPGAVLYALKVFGCGGSTDVTSEAIEWALNPDGDPATDDAVDVINMSLGSDFGDPNDPTALTSQTAVELGVIVVASAGNDGSDISYVHGSPSVAPGAISVAALHDGGVGTPAISVDAPAALAGLKKAVEGDLGRPLAIYGPISGDLIAAQSGNENGCGSISVNMTGKIALIQRGVCNFSVKANNAQAANAMALVVYNNPANGENLVTMAGAAGNDIASVLIGRVDGEALAAELKKAVASITSETTTETTETTTDTTETTTDTTEAPATTETTTGISDTTETLVEPAAEVPGVVTVTMDASFEIPTPELADIVVDFSSRGPGGGGTTFKPDVSAPGVNIRSTLVGSGDRALVLSGTSMASPHVAGVAALLRQRYPNLKVEAIKALIMNSALPTRGGEPITVQGTGSIRANLAAELGAYALPAGVSFGRVNPTSNNEITRKVRVHDLDGGGGRYTINVEALESAAGVTVSAPSSVRVPAGGSASFNIRLTVKPGSMTPDDGFQSQRDINGRVHLTGPGGSLVVGYMGAIDPASKVTTVATDRRRGVVTEVRVKNSARTAGVVDAFTLIGPGLGSIGRVGVRTGNLGGFEVVEFGLANSGGFHWEALSTVETDIFIDTNEDGTDDYALVAADLGYLTTGEAAGLVVTALFNLNTGELLFEYFVVGDYNDRAQVLTVDRFGEFGFLEPGDTTFNYFVAQFDIRTGLIGLAEGAVDLATQADGLTNFSGVVPARGDIKIELADSTVSSMLVLYSNNPLSSQHQIVKIRR